MDSSTPPIVSYYDYQLADPQGKPIALNALPDELLNADVLLVGEWHTHSAIHRFQTDLLKQLISQQPRTVTVSMEQFSRDAQQTLNQYLAGEIGEQVLIQQAGAWPNYPSDYRPLVELAKQKQLAVIASNAPKSIVRCIGQQGLSYLDKLDSKQRTWLAEQIDTRDSPYKEKFIASTHHGNAHHGKTQQTQRQFSAQMAWDETMADSIVSYLTQHPQSQIMHIAGKFHVEQGQGAKASILRRDANLDVVVVSPVTELTNSGSDYQLLVLAPPVRYVQRDNLIQAYQALTQRNDAHQCLP
ncbi:uncharacterized iron-regulated protein [Vibrio ichthyoenteri ATCC 700023]|uniref:Uncharacterized iron-regulated protein n=1 Tax=Vibrio ichthyoenteri ATCC 700023 TaxID=870968 RepID=F9S382_9VIBR|nr:uncharacterized iron-regulated protein [Vibrio ichthyoenteri ATCC 700023]